MIVMENCVPTFTKHRTALSQLKPIREIRQALIGSASRSARGSHCGQRDRDGAGFGARGGKRWRLWRGVIKKRARSVMLPGCVRMRALMSGGGVKARGEACIRCDCVDGRGVVILCHGLFEF